MAGLYLHIPFCQSRCIYCDFYSTTQADLRDRYVEALSQEIAARATGQFATLYVGGGTPSQLTAPQLDRLFTAIHRHAQLDADAEVTLECNPDDVTPDLLHQLRALGVNRLSMGIQTFDDRLLRFLRRRHSAEQAIRAVGMAHAQGFDNLSIDLMFGFPVFSHSLPVHRDRDAAVSAFSADLTTALSLGIQHLSAYSLMYEPGTALTRLRDSGQLHEADDETTLAMYEQLIDRTAEAGFEHYEISNFALPGHRSRHNSSYWDDTPYTGLGAGAHSYDGSTRYYHPDDLTAYLSNPLSLVSETLSHTEHYNEYVMTRLRTREGIHLPSLLRRFGPQLYRYCLAMAKPHLGAGRLSEDGQHYLRLTRQGLFVSDDIMSDLVKV